MLALLPVALAATSAKPLLKRAPLHQARSGQPIPGQYIVKLKEGASDALMSAAAGKLETTTHVFKGPFKEFAGSLDAESLDAVRKLLEIEFVEEDAILSFQENVTVPRIGTDTAPRAIITQIGAAWISLGLLTTHPAGSTVYHYDNSAGAGTCAYVIATGILVSHVSCFPWSLESSRMLPLTKPLSLVIRRQSRLESQICGR